MRLILISVFLLASVWVRAAPLSHTWKPIPSAAFYEFEISTENRFSPQSVVRQGTVETPRVDTELRPGVYFLRTRPVDDAGEIGNWSETARFLLGTLEPRIRIPQSQSRVEIMGPDSPIFVEGIPIEGASEYSLKLLPSAKDRNPRENSKIIEKKGPAPAFSVSGLSPGYWRAQISVHAGGQIVSSSPEVGFFVIKRPTPKPQIETPKDGDSLRAYEVHRVRFHSFRKILGLPSRFEVVLSRESDGAIVSKEPLANRFDTWIPRLGPGSYVLTITDTTLSQSPSSETLRFQIEADPLGEDERLLGVVSRLTSFWGMGWNAKGNDQLEQTFVRSRDPLVDFSFRTLIPVSNPYGLEFSYEQYLNQSFSLRNPVSGSGYNENLADRKFRLLATNAYKPWGPTKPIQLKAGIAFQRHSQPMELCWLPASCPLNAFNTNIVNQPTRQSSFDLYFLSIGADLEWSTWVSRFDFSFSSRLEFPLIRNAGSIFGRGAPAPLPHFYFEAFLRRKMGHTFALLFGGALRLEQITIEESTTPFYSLGPRNSSKKTLTHRGVGGPQIGFEFIF